MNSPEDEYPIEGLPVLSEEESSRQIHADMHRACTEEISQLKSKLGEAGRLQQLTQDNQVRWMEKHSELEVENKKLKQDIDLLASQIVQLRGAIPYPAMTGGNAKAIAWHLRNKGEMGITDEACAAYLESLYQQLDALQIALNNPPPPMVRRDAAEVFLTCLANIEANGRPHVFLRPPTDDLCDCDKCREYQCIVEALAEYRKATA